MSSEHDHTSHREDWAVRPDGRGGIVLLCTRCNVALQHIGREPVAVASAEPAGVLGVHGIDRLAECLAYAQAWHEELVAWVDRRLPNSVSALMVLKLAMMTIDERRSPSISAALDTLVREGLLPLTLEGGA